MNEYDEPKAFAIGRKDGEIQSAITRVDMNGREVIDLIEKLYSRLEQVLKPERPTGEAAQPNKDPSCQIEDRLMEIERVSKDAASRLQTILARLAL